MYILMMFNNFLRKRKTQISLHYQILKDYENKVCYKYIDGKSGDHQRKLFTG